MKKKHRNLSPEELKKAQHILKERKERKKKNRKSYQKKRVIVPGITAVIFLILGILSIIYSFYFQSTDDAFVEGRLISIAPKVSGHIVELYVNDNDAVKEGQLIAQIDKRDYEAKVKQLEASLNEAKATAEVSDSEIDKSQAMLAQASESLDSAKSKLDFAQKDFKRYSALNKDGICTKQEYDSSKTRLEVATSNYNEAIEKQKSMESSLKSANAKSDASIANIEKLEAELEMAKLNLSYTDIYAPQDGNVSSRSVEKGNYVTVGQPLMSVVSPEVWIIANFKETQVGKMKKGQEVTVKIDTFGSKKFKAKVDSIQRASGAKSSLFPPENAVGSYIKIVQRIPVKIIFSEDYSNYNIVPGMSVVPKVKVK
jgi:membrane fusion protein (multidrug efflux system)